MLQITSQVLKSKTLSLSGTFLNSIRCMCVFSKKLGKIRHQIYTWSSSPNMAKCARIWRVKKENLRPKSNFSVNKKKLRFVVPKLSFLTKNIQIWWTKFLQIQVDSGLLGLTPSVYSLHNNSQCENNIRDSFFSLILRSFLKWLRIYYLHHFSL